MRARGSWKASRRPNTLGAGIDIDPGTVKVLQEWRWERELLALPLAMDDALVFGDLEGRHRHPERFSRTFHSALMRCAKALGNDCSRSLKMSMKATFKMSM